MRVFLIILGIVGLLIIVGALFAWRTVKQWTRSGPPKQQLASPSSPAGVGLTITVEQSSERRGHDRSDFEFSEVKAVVSNAKSKAVESPDIHITVNGTPLTFSVPTGNYYDRHPRYSLRDDPRLPLAPETICNFTIGWNDAAPVPAASITLPKKMTLANFKVPETHSANQDLEISWSMIEEPADMVLYKTTTFTDASGNQNFKTGSPNSEDALRKKIAVGSIHSNDGKWIIPASYFKAKGGERVSSVGLEITSTTTGTFNQTFLPGSSIEAQRKLILHVEIH